MYMQDGDGGGGQYTCEGGFFGDGGGGDGGGFAGGGGGGEKSPHGVHFSTVPFVVDTTVSSSFLDSFSIPLTIEVVM